LDGSGLLRHDPGRLVPVTGTTAHNLPTVTRGWPLPS
jgi:hypothetical protein